MEEKRLQEEEEKRIEEEELAKDLEIERIRVNIIPHNRIL
jgi:hypothetical protein